MAADDPAVTDGTQQDEGAQQAEGGSTTPTEAPTVDATLAAVRRKLNITWADEGTDARVQDVIASVTPVLARRCGLDEGHAFAEGQPEWALFLNACLYEFSDALDDFWQNYAGEIAEAHLLNVAGTEPEGAGDA